MHSGDLIRFRSGVVVALLEPAQRGGGWKVLFCETAGHQEHPKGCQVWMDLPTLQAGARLDTRTISSRV